MKKSVLCCICHWVASVALRMTQIHMLTELVWQFTRWVIRAVTVLNLSMNKTLPASVRLHAKRWRALFPVSVWRHQQGSSLNTGLCAHVCVCVHACALKDLLPFTCRGLHMSEVNAKLATEWNNSDPLLLQRFGSGHQVKKHPGPPRCEVPVPPAAAPQHPLIHPAINQHLFAASAIWKWCAVLWK